MKGDEHTQEKVTRSSMGTCVKRRCCHERRCSRTVYVCSPGADGDPGIAPNPLFVAHSDIWMSDTADLPGPLGRNPVVSSTSLAGIVRDSWIAAGGNIAFDSHGRPVAFVYDIDWASVALLDPDKLHVVSSCPPHGHAGPWWGRSPEDSTLGVVRLRLSRQPRSDPHRVGKP